MTEHYREQVEEASKSLGKCGTSRHCIVKCLVRPPSVSATNARQEALSISLRRDNRSFTNSAHARGDHAEA